MEAEQNTHKCERLHEWIDAIESYNDFLLKMESDFPETAKKINRQPYKEIYKELDFSGVCPLSEDQRPNCNDCTEHYGLEEVYRGLRASGQSLSMLGVYEGVDKSREGISKYFKRLFIVAGIIFIFYMVSQIISYYM